jgi:hypothetical protein
VSFVFVGALAVALLVLAPIAAHLLRVRRAQEQPFPPARLVPASPPATRQRRKLEDRALFGVRALAILALALLGAVPLIQCSRLAVFRSGGASVALVLVVDDSMSMRVRDDGDRSRFSIAKRHAMDLVAGSQKGDAIAVVLAGDPVRVALAPTSDFSVAEAVVGDLVPSDRATDLDGAISLATSLISSLPQPERRVVVLSDLCDGHPEGTPVGEGLDAFLWIPPLSLAEDAHDCAILQAEERSGRVVARVACTGSGTDPERSLVVRAGSEEIGRVLLRSRMSGSGGVMDIEVATESRSSSADVVVLEGGSDFIAENDRAPVAHQLETSTIGVLSDRTLSRVETGGPPPVEQALAALQTGAMVQPIPTVPDAVEDLAKYSALVLDDPPGLTPEARDAVRAWLLQGGVALVGLGPRAARAPLGASLDPFVPGVPRWLDEAPDGVNLEDASGFGPSGSSLERLASRGRTQFETDRLQDAKMILRWSDGVPLVVERPMGRGVVYLVGLPFNPTWSDFPLRPAFLALLSRVTELARLRGGSKRIVVGQSWVFEDVPMEVRTAAGPYPIVRSQGKARVTPEEAGRYDIRIDGEVDTRFAVIPAREVDLRPRKAAAATQDSTLGATRSSVDISPWIALVLLGLLASELALRTLKSNRVTSS